MDRDLQYTFLVLGVIAVIVGKRLIAMSAKDAVIRAIQFFIPSVEGFSAVPYWDVNRWSWGYGTQAPGGPGTATITRDQAMQDMLVYAMRDYTQLMGVITRSLTANQWAALLSFSYNLGIGNALKLVPLINSNNDAALQVKWNQYVYADHVVNEDLVDRRAKEWQLWIS